jgi:SAM-dependent methyltransferase
MKKKFNTIVTEVENYYSNKVKEHGPTPQGVDWNSKESQMTRFELLLKVCDTTINFSMIDYGCGYGALAEYMTDQGYTYSYIGYDISAEMIAQAKKRFTNQKNLVFTSDIIGVPPADYVIASGIFNVKGRFAEDTWKEYVENTISHMAGLSRRGFAFNILTTYSDKEYQREDLYYANPGYYLDYCVRNFSRNVALFHHYGLYEFTLLVYLDLENKTGNNQELED